MRQVVPGVVAATQRHGRGGMMAVHPRGSKLPRRSVPWSLFDGAPAPKAGMLVDVFLEDGHVRRIVRNNPAQDPEGVRLTLLGSLRGLARSMAAQVQKAREMGWEVPAVYAEAVAVLETAGELAVKPEGAASSADS